MKIEVADKPTLLARVEQCIAEIKAERKRQDDEFLAEWRKAWCPLPSRPSWWPLHDKPETAVPKPDSLGMWTSYPSSYAWGAMITLKKIRMALLTPNLGVMYLDEEEVEAIEE